MSLLVNFVRGDAPELYLLHGADDTRVRRGHSKSLMEKQVEAGGSRVVRSMKVWATPMPWYLFHVYIVAKARWFVIDRHLLVRQYSQINFTEI